MSKQKQWDSFRASEEARKHFLGLAAHLPLYVLRDPERAVPYFPEEYIVQKGKKSLVFPLEDVSFQLEAMAAWFERERIQPCTHPVLIYMELLALEKQLRRKRSEQKNEWLARLDHWKSHLTVTDRFSGSSGLPQAMVALEEMQNYCQDMAGRLERLQSLEAQTEHFRSDSADADRQELRELKRDVERLRELHRKEKELRTRIEKDLEEKNQAEGRTYQGLALLEKRFEQLTDYCKELEKRNLRAMLEEVRSRINAALRSGQNEALLLRTLKQELADLQQARLHLGHALHNMGLLYLRIGQKERARRELRAARELGVEDPLTNRFLDGS
ncbi:MAG: hypothetical protein HS115_19705 [Spirochaetales bacterium]|nr:hypothetical protein [Spirochaetales bacterium]